MKSALGVLGGMGPLASADFLLSIYDYNMGDTEQDSPVVWLYSDPTFPDRTETFLNQRDDELLELMEQALQKICALNVNRIVIACVTLHHLVPRLPAELQRRIISLPELILSRIGELKQRHLMIASAGTVAMKIFQNSSGWDAAAPYVIFPDAADQQLIHQRIYQEIKANSEVEELISFLADKCEKYEVNGIVAGCTEIHRITRQLAHNEHSQPFIVVDPLQIIAQNYEDFC